MTEGEVTTPADVEPPYKSTDTSVQYYQMQLREHARIQKMLKYVRKCDHVDEAVIMVIENITYMLPTAEGNDYTMGDVAGILHGLPSAQHLLVPEFFG